MGQRKPHSGASGDLPFTGFLPTPGILHGLRASVGARGEAVRVGDCSCRAQGAVRVGNHPVAHPRGDVGAGRAAGSISGCAVGAGWDDGGGHRLVTPCHRGELGDICPGGWGCAGCSQRCCCRAGPWELGEASASHRCPAPAEPLSCPRGAGGTPCRSQTPAVPQVPRVRRQGPGTRPGTHSPGVRCKEQRKMLNFNASTNGLSGEEQKPQRKKGCSPTEGKRRACPAPGSP